MEVRDKPAEIYAEHLVWLDGPLIGGVALYRCPSTSMHWVSRRRADEQLQLQRYVDTAEAQAALGKK